MILGFKKQFKNLILEGSKIHTIREDRNDRWRPGMSIQFATGVRTKQYEKFKDDRCTSVQDISICNDPYFGTKRCVVHVDGRKLDQNELLELSRNDGFAEISEFAKWFGGDFEGKIIHWTYLKY